MADLDDVWLTAEDNARLIAEVDRVADAVVPMLLYWLHGMAGLNLTLLNAYLSALREAP